MSSINAIGSWLWIHSPNFWYHGFRFLKRLKTWGPFIYYVSSFLRFLDPYISMFLVLKPLKISKNWHFPTIPPYKCLRNIWMVPCSCVMPTSKAMSAFRCGVNKGLLPNSWLSWLTCNGLKSRFGISWRRQISSI